MTAIIFNTIVLVLEKDHQMLLFLTLFGLIR